MNEVIAGTAAFLLTLMLWGFGKYPKNSQSRVLSPKIGSKLNNPQITLVKTEVYRHPEKNCFSDEKSDWEAPKTLQEKLNLKRELNKAINSDPDHRLQAVTIAGLWGHKSALPILRRGLKDSDLRVVGAAAALIQKHRNFQRIQTVGRPPRNVARMR